MTNLLEILKSEGTDVEGDPGWETRERSGTFTPVGVMWHHTAAGGTADFPSLKIVREGRSDLPGPLCNLLGGRNSGKFKLISDGRANDSGMGSGRVLYEVRNDRAPSGTAAARGLVDDTSGNPYFFDLELENNGVGEPWKTILLENALRATTALCRSHKWSGNRVIAHKEWTRRKPDPNGIDMSTIRATVQARLTTSQPPPATPVYPPAPADSEWFAYDPGFNGGARTALGRVMGDEWVLVTSPGTGGGPHVKIFNLQGHDIGGAFMAYDVGMTSGVYIACADVDGDGLDEILTAPGTGGGPHVQVWKWTGSHFSAVASFLAYRSDMTAGVVVDGSPGKVVTVPVNASPHVRVFNWDDVRIK